MVGPDQYIVSDNNNWCYMNHSCDPNCEVQRWTVAGTLRLKVVSLRNIDEDEFITINYSHRDGSSLFRKK